MWKVGIRSISAFFAGRTRKVKSEGKRLRLIDGASFSISVSISCGESGEKLKLRRDSDGLFSFVSYQYCQRQNNKNGRQQKNAGVQNNDHAVFSAGESGTGCLCEMGCSCVCKELSHRGFLLSWRWVECSTYFFCLQGGRRLIMQNRMNTQKTEIPSFTHC